MTSPRKPPPKKKKTTTRPETNLDDLIDVPPHGVHLLAAHLVDIKSAIDTVAEALLLPSTSGETAQKDISELAEAASKDIRGILERLDALEQRVGAIDEKPTPTPAHVAAAAPAANGNGKKRGRPSKADLEARAAAAAAAGAEVPGPTPVTAPLPPAPPVAAPTPAPAAQTPPPVTNQEQQIHDFVVGHPGAKPVDLVREFKVSLNRASAYIELWGTPAPAYVPPNPCPGCGVNLNDATVVHTAACPVAHPKAAPVPPPAPPVAAPAAPAPAPVNNAASYTIDDVRAVAITYAGKHGKEKLGAVLRKYGAGNLSSVPAEMYAALMAELQGA